MIDDMQYFEMVIGEGNRDANLERLEAFRAAAEEACPGLLSDIGWAWADGLSGAEWETVAEATMAGHNAGAARLEELEEDEQC